MKYEIQLTLRAKKQLKKIDYKHQSRIISKINVLSATPRIKAVKKLTGRNAHRYRVGDYRVIFEIIDSKVLILIIDIDHRKQVYKKQ